MRTKRTNIFYGVDLTLVLLYLFLIAFGWMNIYAASVTEQAHEILDFGTKYGKQLLWISLSFVLIVILLFFDAKTYEKFASILYILSLSSLLGLFVFGKTINGATSWYSLGNFSLQPSEFVKFATALALARLVSDRQYDLKLVKNQVKAIVLVFLPAALITLQPDPGSALVYISFFFVLYREGLPLHFITIGAIAILLFLLTLAFGFQSVLLVCYVLLVFFILYVLLYKKKSLKFHWAKIFGLFAIVGLFLFSVDYVFNSVFEQRHRDRFNILLGKNNDTKGVGYNTNQSVLTVKSGGFSGKGFLQGDRTRGDFVPEQHTDYIFSALGEEWGFLGSSLLVLLFTAFVLRILYLAERQKTTFSRVYGYGIAAVFFFHYTINIGMVIGLFPTIGIPLPFFSYGGSALWGFTVLLFLFIKLDASRSYEL
ncbi:MAG: rod shape-determining protein RodA [Flavicella sp.]|nr:rod shape-determining protein RodA [Flavicella sp.]